MTLTALSKGHFKDLYLWSLKKGISRTVVYSVFLVLFIFVPYIFSHDGERYSRAYLENIVNTYLILGNLVVLIFTLITGASSFSYLHSKRTTDMFGSLPTSRRTLFFARLSAAFTSLAVPFIFITILLSPMLLSTGTDVVIVVWKYLFYILLSSLAMLSFMALLSLCCGTTADAVVSALIICLIYPITLFCGQQYLSGLLPGFIFEADYSPVLLTALCPIAAGFTIREQFTMSEISDSGNLDYTLWWLFFSAAVIALCYLIAKRRKAESAQSGFAFKFPQVLIRLFASLSSGLVLAMMFVSASRGDAMHIWFVTGFVLGSFTAHLTLYVFYNRGFKKFAKSTLALVGVVFAAIALHCIVSTGLFGYSTYVPDPDSIESVECDVSYSSSYMFQGVTRVELKEEESIQKAVALHSAIADNLSKHRGSPYRFASYSGYFYYGNNYYTGPNTVFLKYNLKNGLTVTRQFYYYDYGEEIVDLARSVSKTKEYLNILSHIFDKNKNAAFNEINLTKFINSNTYSSLIYSVSDYPSEKNKPENHEALKDEIIDAIKKDISNDPDYSGNYYLESTPAYEEGGLFITFNIYAYIEEEGQMNNHNYFINVKKSYSNTLNILEERGFLNIDEMQQITTEY